MAKKATATTPSKAKNAIKRCLREIIDPSPRSKLIDDLWSHFGNKCAYCAAPLSRERREGHLDHLIPEAKRGGNGIGNLVLACGSCNGDQKLDKPWKEFLNDACPDATERTDRQKLIEEWLDKHNKTEPVPEAFEGTFNATLKDVFTAFDKACNDLRAARQTTVPLVNEPKK